MKIYRHGLFLFAAIWLVGAFQLAAGEITNQTTPFQESWETISNRWSSLPFEKIQKAGKMGDCTAQYYLGYAYNDGNGIAKNPVESFNWMNLAAQQGMARAQRQLGWSYLNGLGVEADAAQAFGWYQKGAQQNDAISQMNLGWMYEHGSGVAQDYEQAAKFYRLAANQGHAMAQNNLGWLYRKGWGVSQNSIEAANWFQKSAEHGEKLGAENLAWMYKDGAGVKQNFNLAEEWMLRAVDTNTAAGSYKLAEFLSVIADREVDIYHQDTNRFPNGIPNDEWYKGTTRYVAAAYWFQKSAEANHSEAAYELADMYHIGKLGDDQRTNCIPWFLKAAAQGNADAKAKISSLSQFYPGNKLLKNVDVIDNLKQAAGQDDLDAQFDLAWRYHHGDGVSKDDVEAFKWMEKAVLHGVTPVTKTIDAHYYLGVMYENGIGTPTNLSKAYELYQEAAVGGNKPEPFTRLGQMYENGESLPQDDYLAATNYFIATQFGFVPTSDDTARCKAIENLLGLYVQGRGVPTNGISARDQLGELIRTPITTAKAQKLLGKIYQSGKVLPQDLAESASWFKLAAKENSTDVYAEFQRVYGLLSAAQKTTMEKRFSELEQKIGQAIDSYHRLEPSRRGQVW